MYSSTVEPCYNERAEDWQNVFAITRFHYIKVLFQIFYYYWGRGLIICFTKDFII